MASRKDQKEALRRERLERERAAAEAARRRRLVLLGAGAVVAAAVVIFGVVMGIDQLGGGGNGGSGQEGEFPERSEPLPAPRGLELRPAAQAAGCTVRDLEEEGNQHVGGPVQYRSNPPTSGNHAAEPAEDGAYTSAPAKEALVHSLEHGRVVMQFRPGAPEEVRGGLKALFDEDPYQMVLVPNETNMPFEVAATAWRHLLGCPRMNDRVYDALRAFRDEYRGRGPEPVP